MASPVRKWLGLDFHRLGGSLGPADGKRASLLRNWRCSDRHGSAASLPISLIFNRWEFFYLRARRPGSRNGGAVLLLKFNNRPSMGSRGADDRPVVAGASNNARNSIRLWSVAGEEPRSARPVGSNLGLASACLNGPGVPTGRPSPPCLSPGARSTTNRQGHPRVSQTRRFGG